MSTVLEQALPALLSASLKAALLIAGVALITRRMGRAPAAVRHLVWSLALAGALLLPILSLAVPALPVLPRVSAPVPLVTEVVTRPRAEVVPPAVGATSSHAQARDVVAPAAPRGGLRVDWGVWLPLLWAAGAAAVLIRLLTGVAGVWWLGRRAEMVTDGGWLHLAHHLARRLGLSRGVTLLRGDRGLVPMTWGVLQPIIWLPPAAEEWSPERRTVVLAHELAHVRRRDALTQWIAHLALVVHWFNPLVWYAVRRQREERERACDDAVLEIGTLPTTYADHLLDLVRSLGGQNGPVAAMAMARRSQFEGRLLAILDGAVRRGGIDRGAALGSLACALVVILPLASLRAGEPTAQLEAVATRTERSAAAFAPTARLMESGGVMQEGPRRSPAPAVIAPRADTAAAAGGAGSQDPISLVTLIREMDSDGEKASLLIRALGLPNSTPALRREVARAASSIGSSGDRAAVLLAVLRQGDRSPELAVEVLAAIRDLESDGDAASVLHQLVPGLPLERAAVCNALFAALEEIDSPGDRTSVLHKLVSRPLPDATLLKAVRVAGRIESDGDATSVLVRAARNHRARIRGEIYDAYLEAARSISSSGDRAAALAALLEAPRSQPAPAPETAAAPSPRRTTTFDFSRDEVLQGSHDGQPAYDLSFSARQVVLTANRDGFADVRPGGHLSVRHTRYPGSPDPDPLLPAGSGESVTRHLEVRPGEDGPRIDYRVNGERREFGDEGRAWLAGLLRRMQRR